jgi:ATP-dependent protease ClpP protease subunit
MKQEFKKQPVVGVYTSCYSDAIPVSYQPIRAGTYEADLHGYIEDAAQFSQMVSALGIMEEEDTFVLNLQSGGGSLNACDSLVHAFRKCKGTIHICATGNCSSAATFLLLEAHSFELSEGFNSTLHCGSLSSGGTYSEYKQDTAFYNKFMPDTLRRYYEGFLTTEEMEKMLDGKDILLGAEEWSERYEKRNLYFQAKHDAQQVEEQAALLASQEPSPKPRPQKRPLSIGKLKAVQGPQGVVE